MKKNVMIPIVCIVFVIFFNHVEAQHPKFTFGTGLGISKLKVSYLDEIDFYDDYVFRPSFFLSSEFPITKKGKVDLCFGISYRQYGIEINRDNLIGYIDTDYFTLMSGLKVMLNRGIFRFYIKPNLYYGILINAKSDGDNITEIIESQDVGFDINCGFEFLITQVFKTFLEVKYSHGLNNIDSKSALYKEVKNRGLFLIVGIIL